MLDNEAAQALADPWHAKHRRLTETLRAADLRHRTQVLVPTAVRLEAGLSRTSPTSAHLARFKVDDAALTGARADRAVVLRAGSTASVVDATVAQLAEEHAAAGALVTIYTSDVPDLEQLCRRAAGRIAVRRV